MTSNAPFYSIVIPNYRDARVNQCFDAVKDIPDAEIVVAESGDRCLTEDRREACKYRFSEDRLMPGGTRNLGAAAARGEYILFVDSDVILTDEAKAYLAEFRAHPRREIVFGLYAIDGSPTRAARFQNAVLRHRFLDLYRKAPLAYGQSSHMIISRRAFQETGGFNPYLRMREDTEFCCRANAFGYPNVVEERFVGRHLKHFTFASLVRDYFNRTYYAIGVKYDFPAIFMNISDMMSPAMMLSYALAALWPVAALLAAWGVDLTGLGLPVAVAPNGINALIALALFLQPLVLVPRIFGALDGGTQLLGLVVWPLTFLAMVGGGLLATGARFFGWIRRQARSLADWWLLTWRVVRRSGLPVQIIQFVTSRCNLRCEHCFYKESLDDPNPGEQPLELFGKLSKDVHPLLWYAFAGGEPFIRKDLADIYHTISTVARPKLITIPSNGWYQDRMLQTVLRMLQENPRQALIVQFSMDGPQEMHDAIRGENSYGRAIASFQMLKVLRGLYPNLQLAFITVVNQANKHIYPAFIDELVALEPNQVNINLFRYGYKDHPPLDGDLVDTYQHAVEYYEGLLRRKILPTMSILGARSLRLKEVLQKELIAQIARTNEFVTPCTAGTLSYVIWEDGRLGPCEILPDEVLNLAEDLPNHRPGRWRDIFLSDKARALGSRIVDTKCTCTYECAMSNNTFFSWPMTRKFARRYVRDFLRY